MNNFAARSHLPTTLVCKRYLVAFELDESVSNIHVEVEEQGWEIIFDLME